MTLHPSPRSWFRRLSLAGFFLVACSAALAADMQQENGKLVALLVKQDRSLPAVGANAADRTPASIEAGLAEDLASRLPSGAVAGNWSRVQLRTVADISALPVSRTVVPVQYEIAPMAILRTDTAIAQPQQLKAQVVCLAQGGNYAGIAEARYGAIEKTYPSLTDALVALRTGGCDAVVHDSTVLQELAGQPEWKKFAARLPLGEARTLAFVIPAGERQTVAQLTQIVGDWNAKSVPHALARKVASKLASAVQLTQKAPDSY
ncbi:transporter substrate-binding domain-containing protein [Lacisediminimonas sp.]|uniref:transporter substrate-binding domain-containing protein n=1 Tax=Lacisediminimonas sp. TaxID=3060582 RepID=UPI002724110E|nr:transporter substrate-binding domain-containing protein [Lacisediminimonas sp.]MDO8299038.1 transporter substrate-binding domain-containing protein [Lacisediminimonas sp.]